MREQILEEKARLLSSDFAFKRVIATGDRATIRSALRNHSGRVGADVMLLLDPSAEVMASTLASPQPDDVRVLRMLVEAALADDFGETSSIQRLAGDPYQLAVVPLLTPEPSAWIVIGFGVGDALAGALKEQTGTEVSLLRRAGGAPGAWTAFATTLCPASRRSLERGLSQEPVGAQRMLNLDLDGEAYISSVLPLEGGFPLLAVLQRSLAEALQPFLRLRAMLLAIFGVGIVLSLASSGLLASSVTRPVAALARGARRIGLGDYSDPVRVSRRDELGDLADAFNAMMKGLAERDQVRDLLGRVVAPEIAEELLAKEIELGGEEREVTVLFADVRGFTALAEREDPQRLVRILNTFLTALSAAIEAQGGVVEEYMGDGAKAIFGAPITHPEDAPRAVRAALALQASMPEVDAGVRALGGAPLQIGIGINTGEAVAGKMGSLSRLKYTVVGDSVNVASRLEGLTRHYGVKIVVSETTRARCPDLVFRELDRVRVKGRDGPLVIFEPLGATEDLDVPTRARLERHHEALARLRARDWEGARDGFARLLAVEPASVLYRFYLERIERLRAEPPGPDWDGTLDFHEK